MSENITKINPAADFDAREYNLPGHVAGLRMNDPETLASVFKILIEQPLESDVLYDAGSARWLGY